ncbi:ubiquinone/menaquinone biosynthesis C-methylase UbiE [Methanomicrobium sp. W14]|uniref:class I SAM-dependent methyltransferase n=1 Tax=Methanomicrobium sp. W14 TaxID=2817839 RepID=UPI001AE7C97C|nr:class I SAM-dependent methyltransferase [Methanomicrobium sp. W14]MBP2133306.1 ubiquinone/menaquinone biosynthesis C-methylase UbiE [Methanomicrobium sp. W14]
MLKQFFSNTRKPKSSAGGNFILWLMNTGHDRLAKWGLSYLDFSEKMAILDVGCGGGKNISNLLELAPKAEVFGADYSEASVKKSKDFNREAIKKGRCKVFHASVGNLPFEDESFDAVTAFETVYFWPDLNINFTEINRILQNGGVFMVCNEAASQKDAEKWLKYIDMSVFTGDELSSAMKNAGFTEIIIYERTKGSGICVTGIKP